MTLQEPCLKRLIVGLESTDRHNNINLMRFIAATAVIYGHMFDLSGQAPVEVGKYSAATIGVYVFFLLSGYLVTTSVMRDSNPFRYVLRRVFRIMPALVFLVIATVFILGPLMTSLSMREYFTTRETYRYFLNISLNPQYSLPGVFQNNPVVASINGSLWTLPVEFFMYILIYCIVVALQYFRCLKIGLLAITTIAIGFNLMQYAGLWSCEYVIWGTSIAQALILIPYFLLGALFAVFNLSKKLNIQTAFILLTIFAYIPATVLRWEREIISFFVITYATFALAFATPARFGRIFSENDYSYGIYLWGFPVQQSVLAVLGPDIPASLLALVSFSIAFILASFSWFAIERPCGKLSKRLITWSKQIGKNRSIERL